VDQRVRLLHCPENVIAKSLNTGVAAAQGRYIAQLDSDDEYIPDTLRSMVGYLEENPEMGLAISYYELMDERGKSLEEFGIIKHLEYNKNNILRVDGAGAVRVWRKSVLKEMGGFDEKELGGYGEDYDLVLKVSERYQVGRVHEVLYRYRRHGGNTDALIDNQRKIRAKSLARQNALRRRRELNLRLQKHAG
jgi:GT2 family glycosyltransferase